MTLLLPFALHSITWADPPPPRATACARESEDRFPFSISVIRRFEASHRFFRNWVRPNQRTPNLGHPLRPFNDNRLP
jgi:hypothetical protein